MTEKQCLANELAVTPTSEEGGIAKVADAGDASRSLESTCVDSPAEFCSAEKNSVRAEEAFSIESALSSLSPARFVRTGRPPKLDAELKNRACILLCLGLSRRQAAVWLDVDAGTITHAAQSDPDFGRALERAEEFRRSCPTVAMMAAALKNWRAAAWLLKHQETKLPISMSSEERAERHQAYLELSRLSAESDLVTDVLREEREAAREGRKAARDQAIKDRKQARFEAENPQLFRHRKKKKEKAAERPGESK
ncbi:MAG: hypothetical protein ACR2FY_11300 [Pirellulaceae bacterium]